MNKWFLLNSPSKRLPFYRTHNTSKFTFNKQLHKRTKEHYQIYEEKCYGNILNLYFFLHNMTIRHAELQKWHTRGMRDQISIKIVFFISSSNSDKVLHFFKHDALFKFQSNEFHAHIHCIIKISHHIQQLVHKKATLTEKQLHLSFQKLLPTNLLTNVKEIKSRVKQHKSYKVKFFILNVAQIGENIA